MLLIDRLSNQLIVQKTTIIILSSAMQKKEIYNNGKCFQLLVAAVWLVVLMTVGESQHCMNSAGQPVSWWVILKVPPLIKNSGYGYYDSNTKTGQFVYVNRTVDLDVSPLTQTISVLSSDKIQRIAWNDEKPTNQTSSTEAHSKGLIAYSKSSNRGFYIVHSIPKYPAFFTNHSINSTIGKSQQVYGQHLACFSLSVYELNNLAAKIQNIRPYIYQYVVSQTVATQHLHDLAHGALPITKELFDYYDMKPVNYTVRAIFKTNAVNGSIFEDGLVKWLKAGKLMAQTWGRPLEGPWCYAGMEVINVKQVTLTPTIKWTQTQDHSKWTLLESKYSCFGDMNRMTSQWKRGGAFYCLDDVSLHAALKKVIGATDKCETAEYNKTESSSLNHLQVE